MLRSNGTREIDTWISIASALVGFEHDTKATARNIGPQGRTVRKKANASDFQGKPPKSGWKQGTGYSASKRAGFYQMTDKVR